MQQIRAKAIKCIRKKALHCSRTGALQKINHHESINFIPVEQLRRKKALRLKDDDPMEKVYLGKYQQP